MAAAAGCALDLRSVPGRDRVVPPAHHDKPQGRQQEPLQERQHPHARDASGQVVQPVLPYTVTITYGPIDLAYGDAIESTLALYRWSGTAWVQEPTSRLDAEANTVTATPKRFSTWAVLGEARSGGKVYLPLLTQSGP